VYTIKIGTRVRIKPEAVGERHPHLLGHARARDVGVLAPPPSQSPAMATLYVIVHFEECGQDHRLLPSEIGRA
jgi:hypothetical protein